MKKIHFLTKILEKISWIFSYILFGIQFIKEIFSKTYPQDFWIIIGVFVVVSLILMVLNLVLESIVYKK